MVLSQYRVVLSLDGTRYRACMPVYIEKVEIWSGGTGASLTDSLLKIGLLSLLKIELLSS